MNYNLVENLKKNLLVFASVKTKNNLLYYLNFVKRMSLDYFYMDFTTTGTITININYQNYTVNKIKIDT